MAKKKKGIIVPLSQCECSCFSSNKTKVIVWGLLLKREPLPVSDILFKVYPHFWKSDLQAVCGVKAN